MGDSMKKLIDQLENKIHLKKIKIFNYLYLKKLDFDRQKYGFIYILLFLLSLIFSLIISNFLNITNVDEFATLFSDTGIALIGLSGIIFTLQIFTQETNNNYTNSVMEKIVNLKFQHIIEYVYIITITFIFLLIPKTSVFLNGINLLAPFYFLTIIIIFIMLGTDLFVSTKLSNKRQLIIIIEKRINYILDGIEKIYLDFDNYSKKNNLGNPPLIDYIAKSNRIFSSYVQCINYILRGSINDPLLFENGMESYIKIVKKRLEKRKNRLVHVDIPFFNEILPTTGNDGFIEKYILEYLNEYADIALENKNRDIIQIIQRIYHEIILLGKDNTYVNDGKIELTIRITFTYYLDVVKKIVKMNNENMLFETIEVFKDIFINHGKYYYDLLDDSFAEFINESVDIALENKSAMNYRNLLEIANIPINCILLNKDHYNYLRVEPILNSIKSNIFKFVTTPGLIKRRDGARLYLQFVFNSADPNGLQNCLITFYNSNISDNGDYIDYSDRVYEIIKRFVEFYTSKEILACLKVLYNDNRFVTGFVDYRYTLGIFTRMLLYMINSNQFKHCNDKLKCLLRICFKSVGEMVLRYDSNSMRISELDDFYKDDIYNSLKDLIEHNNLIKQLYFDNYYISLTTTYDKNLKARKNIDNYFEFLSLLIISFDNDEMLDKFINWYFDNVQTNIVGMIYEYKEIIAFGHFGHESLSYEHRKIIKDKIYTLIEKRLKECSATELGDIVVKLNMKISKQVKKQNKIKCILECIKK